MLSREQFPVSLNGRSGELCRQPHTSLESKPEDVHSSRRSDFYQACMGSDTPQGQPAQHSLPHPAGPSPFGKLAFLHVAMWRALKALQTAAFPKSYLEEVLKSPHQDASHFHSLRLLTSSLELFSAPDHSECLNICSFL